MRTLTATDLAHNLRRVLDSLENGEEEIVVTRNNHAIARLVPGAPRMTALEAMSDLFRTLDDAEGAEWLKDIAKADRPLKRETRDPWA